MRLKITPKLFLGFVGIISLNVFFFVVVSNLENVINIANILKRQNEVKNLMLRLKTLHRVQAPSVASFERLGRQESVDNFSRTQREIIALSDSIDKKIDSIKLLNELDQLNYRSSLNSEALNALKSLMNALRIYNGMYASAFDAIVQLKTSPADKKKADDFRKNLDTAGIKLTQVIDSAETIVDNQTNQRIKEVEFRISNVKSKTIYIIIGITVAAIVFGLWFSSYITTALRRLTVAAGSIGKGDFDVDPHGYPKDEIGDLASAFFQMSVDLKNAQEALVRSKRLAAIGEVVASVNHEINNPLMIISGNAQFLQMTMDKYPDEMKERVHTILEETERISQVTRKLREIKNPVVEDYTSSGEQMINLDKSSS